MVDPVTVAIAVIIIASVIGLAWYTARRDWNVERQDDRRRPDGDGPEEENR